MSESCGGFLHLEDLVETQRRDPLFTTPDLTRDDVEEQMQDQIKSDKGVAFDLRLGNQFYLSGEFKTRKAEDESGIIKIEPGQFALLTTYEIFHMPVDYVAFISMRFGVKAEGLINVSGFQVDPGYQGIFIFSVYNAGPKVVTLEYKSKIFTIIFAKTSHPVREKRPSINSIPKDKWGKLTNTKNISQMELDDRISDLERWRKGVQYIIPTAAVIIGTIVTVLEVIYRFGGHT